MPNPKQINKLSYCKRLSLHSVIRAVIVAIASFEIS